ncbi:MAG: chromate efflux transporter [Thaumarchaeota archaeon]|nr:chromate efflux transporter [Nitrososphaerota archaeon]
MTDKQVGSRSEVFLTALKLGLTCFGGPIAHLGYFREEYVVRKKWIDDQSFANAVAYANSVPGASSSQVGIIVGTHRAGIWGGIVAWIGFTLPSALILIVFGNIVSNLSDSVTNASWLHGLKIAAVVIVAQAVWGMAQRLAPDKERASIAVGSVVASLALFGIALGQILIIAAAGLIGFLFLKKVPIPSATGSVAARIPRWLSISSLILFFVLLVALPIFREAFPQFQIVAVVDSFYRSGSLVFGGGHVVLPLLNAEIVRSGWVSSSQFLAGYGLTQAMPGPLFTFSAYLGTVMSVKPNGVLGGLIALVSIFLPSFLLVYGPLPFWSSLMSRNAFQSVIAGINAAVVGILLAALYNPIFLTSIMSPADFALAVVLGLLLFVWKRPPWNVVLIAAIGGLLIGLLGLT